MGRSVWWSWKSEYVVFLVAGMVLLDSRCVFFSVISGLGVFSDITSPHIQFVGTLRDGRGGGGVLLLVLERLYFDLLY